MKILMLRRNAGLYGAENVILLLSKILIQWGHRPVIGVINDSRYPCRELIDKANQRKLPVVEFVSNRRLDWKTVKDIRRYMLNHHVDMVHTHGFKADIYGFLATIRTRVPVMATKHGWTKSNRLIRMWERVDLFCLRFFASIVAVSDDMMLTMKKMGLPKNKLGVIYNGIEIVTPDFDRHQLIASLQAENKPVIGIIARLSIEKGHTNFIQAARHIVKEKPDTCFLIPGEGPLKEQLIEEAKEAGLEHKMHFLGFRKDILNLIDIMDVLVSSSNREGIPINLLEAMAQKKPIVATNVGGVGTLIRNNETGILMQKNDPPLLAEHILDLLNHPGKAERLGDGAYSHVISHFSGEAMTRQYLNIYETLVQTKEDKT